MGAAERREDTYAVREIRAMEALLKRVKPFSVTVSPQVDATQRVRRHLC